VGANPITGACAHHRCLRPSQGFPGHLPQSPLAPDLPKVGSGMRCAGPGRGRGRPPQASLCIALVQPVLHFLTAGKTAQNQGIDLQNQSAKPKGAKTMALICTRSAPLRRAQTAEHPAATTRCSPHFVHPCACICQHQGFMRPLALHVPLHSRAARRRLSTCWSTACWTWWYRAHS